MFVTAVSSQFASVSPHGAPSGGVGGLDAGPDGGDGGERPEVGARHHVVESVLLQIGDMFPLPFRVLAVLANVVCLGAIHK